MSEGGKGERLSHDPGSGPRDAGEKYEKEGKKENEWKRKSSNVREKSDSNEKKMKEGGIYL